MRLVIAEKPSVARDLARVLGARSRRDGYFEGNDLRISWCVGHMVELEDPAHYNSAWKRWAMDALPMIPDQFSLRLREGIADQWKVLSHLLRDRQLQEVINACDAGREGELIFRYVYQMAGCQQPVQRLWVSSLTDQAIQTGWSQLRPAGRYDALADAARCRSEADWLVGLNATRAMTCLARRGGGEQLLSVGRVQTPTLAMIVQRDQEIAAFVPEAFWQIKATFSAAAGDAAVRWEARWFQPPQRGAPQERERDNPAEAPRAERLATEAAAKAVAAAAQGQVGEIGTAERKQIREVPPLLYDLSALQQRANQRYGWSADYTLQLAQELYEKHKLISYPRTDAQYLMPDQVPELPGIVDSLGQLPVYQPFCQQIRSAPIKPGKRVVNPAEVGDHHAILPTGRVPDPGRLSIDEKRLYDLVARRLLAALSLDALFDVATIVVEVAPRAEVALPDDIAVPLCFRARGRICTQEGWRAVDPPGKSRELELPEVQAGHPASAEAMKVERGETRPPRPHSDGSLLRAMETAGRELDDAELKRAMRSAGLGTPATRAAIIQTLLKREYIERRGRDLRATDRGSALITAIPVEQLKSAELTGRWEARLSAMADGNEQRDAFMADVRTSLHALVEAIKAAEPPPAERIQSDAAELGPCPLCGEPVRERRSVYACDRGRACDFVIFKMMSKRKISAASVKQLLQTGRSRPLKNFKSKKGNAFSAALVLSEDKKVTFEFVNDREEGGSDNSSGSGRSAAPPAPPAPSSTEKKAPPAREKKAPPPPAPAPQTPVGMGCPACGQGQLIQGRAAWGCSRWREGCRYTLAFVVDGRPQTAAEAAAQVAAAHAGMQPS